MRLTSLSFFSRAKSVCTRLQRTACVLCLRFLRLVIRGSFSHSLFLFCSVCRQTLSRAYVSELVLHLKGYRFYAVYEEDFSLFILSVTHTHTQALFSQLRNTRSGSQLSARSTRSCCSCTLVSSVPLSLSLSWQIHGASVRPRSGVI